MRVFDVDSIDCAQHSDSELSDSMGFAMATSPISHAYASTTACAHDPYFHCMEVCRFCDTEICSSCRIHCIDTKCSEADKDNADKSGSDDDSDSLIISDTEPDHDSELDLLDIETYQCKPCTIQAELKAMSDSICDAILCHADTGTLLHHFEMHIIEIIASYSVGYIIECCNIQQSCCNEISITNRFDLQQPRLCVDSDRHTLMNIAYTECNQELAEHAEPRKYVEIYGQKRIIFCNQCVCPSASASESQATPVATPFMMLMTTKRFQKNHFGVYQ